MKKILILTLSLGLLCSTGCNTTPLNKAVKSEAVLITSVDTGMHVWYDRVIAGNATQNQVDTVKAAYVTYYNAQQIAKAALEKWAASGNPTDSAASVVANQAVENAKQSLLNLINQYIK